MDGKTEALDELIEYTEKGVGLADTDFFDDMDKWAWTAYVDAMEGSLDAAKALHEALLPGWRVSIGHGEDDAIEATVFLNTAGSFMSASDEIMSRAWLIAILKAYRAQQQE